MVFKAFVGGQRVSKSRLLLILFTKRLLASDDLPALKATPIDLPWILPMKMSPAAWYTSYVAL